MLFPATLSSRSIRQPDSRRIAFAGSRHRLGRLEVAAELFDLLAPSPHEGRVRELVPTLATGPRSAARAGPTSASPEGGSVHDNAVLDPNPTTGIAGCCAHTPRGSNLPEETWSAGSDRNTPSEYPSLGIVVEHLAQPGSRKRGLSGRRAVSHRGSAQARVVRVGSGASTPTRPDDHYPRV
jgi:hypothetical protein